MEPDSAAFDSLSGMGQVVNVLVAAMLALLVLGLVLSLFGGRRR